MNPYRSFPGVMSMRDNCLSTVPCENELFVFPVDPMKAIIYCHIKWADTINVSFIDNHRAAGFVYNIIYYGG